jgi:hypothetical protein
MRILAFLVFLFYSIGATLADDGYTEKEERLFEYIYQQYGPKNTQLSVDPKFMMAPRSASEYYKEINRWYGITKEPHWHQSEKDKTFENFTSRLQFAPIDPKFSEASVVCKNRYREPRTASEKIVKLLRLSKGKYVRDYNEILFYSDGMRWMDINQAPSDDGSIFNKNYKYSLTLWDWYNTVAIKSGEKYYLSPHRQPSFGRWNEAISNDMVKEIADSAAFNIYIEVNMNRYDGVSMTDDYKRENAILPPLFNMSGKVIIKNPQVMRECLMSKDENRNINNIMFENLLVIGSPLLPIIYWLNQFNS